MLAGAHASIGMPKDLAVPSTLARRWVTWAEFIEAGWLSAYPQRKRVPIVELRTFIERLREQTRVPYPLAHAQLLVSGRA